MGLRAEAIGWQGKLQALWEHARTAATAIGVTGTDAVEKRLRVLSIHSGSWVAARGQARRVQAIVQAAVAFFFEAITYGAKRT